MTEEELEIRLRLRGVICLRGVIMTEGRYNDCDRSLKIDNN